MSSTQAPSFESRVIGAALIGLGLGLSCASLAFAAGAPSPAGHASAASKTPAPPRPVDINSATGAQLTRLAGIDEAQADRIVAGRPYLSKADLATRNVIPTGIYLALKNQIVAIQKPKPKGRGWPAGALAPAAADR